MPGDIIFDSRVKEFACPQVILLVFANAPYFFIGQAFIG